MTGRDLIIHILNNNLEDEPIFSNGHFMGFMTVTEAAKKYAVGEHTIKTWYATGRLKFFAIGEMIFIPINAEVVIQ